MANYFCRACGEMHNFRGYQEYTEYGQEEIFFNEEGEITDWGDRDTHDSESGDWTDIECCNCGESVEWLVDDEYEEAIEEWNEEHPDDIRSIDEPRPGLGIVTNTPSKVKTWKARIEGD